MGTPSNSPFYMLTSYSLVFVTQYRIPIPIPIIMIMIMIIHTTSVLYVEGSDERTTVHILIHTTSVLYVEGSDERTTVHILIHTNSYYVLLLSGRGWWKKEKEPPGENGGLINWMAMNLHMTWTRLHTRTLPRGQLSIVRTFVGLWNTIQFKKPRLKHEWLSFPPNIFRYRPVQ